METRKMILIDDVTAELDECVLIHVISQLMNGQKKEKLEKEYGIEIRPTRTERISSFGIYKKEED